MPRGKYVKKNKRNENVLISKLMRMSLRMDDHIYNDKPITTPEAGTHLHEIAILKLQCLPTNVRALQVIEKLTRFMSNILTEEETGYIRSSRDNSFQINTEYAGSASPVYSLPDEDKISDIYEQNVDLNTKYISDDESLHKENNIPHTRDNRTVDIAGPVSSLSDKYRINDIYGQNGVENWNTRNEQTNILHDQFNLNTSNKPGHITITSQAENSLPCHNNTFDDEQVIDITNDSDTEEAAQFVAVSNEQNISIEQVNTGISNMVIQDELADQTNVNDDNCSQSILDKCDNEIVMNEQDRVVMEKEPCNGRDIKGRVINNVNHYFQIQTPLAHVPSQDKNGAATKPLSNQPDKLNFNVDTRGKTINQGTVIQEKNKIEKKKKVTNENNNKFKGRKMKNKSKSKEGTASQNYLQNGPITNMFQDVTYGNAYVKENRLKTLKKSKNLKRVNEIYNENVENDLSWVENIRYVREISPTEYDPALTILQEKFWDNFELPAFWNDLDFEM